MTRYLPLKGIITSISESRTGGSGAASCTLLFSIQGEDGNVFSFVISPSTYVLNQESFRPGDTIIAFYDSLAPMPLIYPPSYQAVAAIKPWKEQSAMLDVFDQNLKNSDNSLVLNLSPAWISPQPWCGNCPDTAASASDKARTPPGSRNPRFPPQF